MLRKGVNHLLPAKPAGVVEFICINRQRIILRGCVSADHQGARERPGLAGEVADVRHIDACFFLELSSDRRFDRFTRLDEARKCRIPAGRIMRLPAEQQAPFMLRQHDHHRIDAGIMFGAARSAGARPAAPIGLGDLAADRAMAVAPMPVGKAESGGKRRSFAGIDQRKELEMGAGVDRRGSVGKVGKAWRVTVQPEKQGRGATNGLPTQAAQFADCRSSIFPDELQCGGMAGQLPDGIGGATQMIGAVETRTGEKWLRRQGIPFATA